jgi:fumarate hydratase subunit alpha
MPDERIPVMKIPFQLIEEVIINLLRMAVTTLPRDVIDALEAALRREGNPTAKTQLEAILANIRLAEETGTPMCQDTGVPLIFIKGHYEEGIEEAVRRGVERATPAVPLRPNAVHPITRQNSGTNVGDGIPYIRWRPTMDEMVEITVMPKGAGSENMSRSVMLPPSDGVRGIKRFVLDAVVEAGGKPCPPTIVGLGIGGTSDVASLLAKEALLVPLNEENPDPLLRSLEAELFEALNSTGIGPMGLGGDTTVLGVRARAAYCHTASLPVAVNLQCWAARKAFARIYPDGMVTYSREGFE